jgi:DNA helicase-2/ATP-dependent DNA helicase PcrA
MSDDHSHNDVLQSERAVNETYRSKTRRYLDDLRRTVGRITALPANAFWSSGSARTATPSGDLHPIVGRVGFDPIEDCPVEGDLYVGPYFQELDGFTVVSWSAPVASLFFEGRRSSDVAARSVAGMRTFMTKQDEIVDFDDRLERGVSKSPFDGPRRGGLDVPLPPRVDLPRGVESNVAGSDDPSSADPEIPVEESTTEGDDVFEDDDVSVQADDVDAGTEEDDATIVEGEVVGLRAERIVRAAIESPRTGRLSSVLTTLQPDQYELVTWPDDRPLIVSGQPGTGKTIVAMHRAGFLTHPDRPGGPIGRVLVVGPTDEYVDHVRYVSESVGGSDVPVVGVNSLLGRLAKVDHRQMGLGRYDLNSVNKDLLFVARLVASDLPKGGTPSQRFDAVLKDLVTKGPSHVARVRDPSLSAWLTSIGSVQNARKETKYLPLLASIGVAVYGVPADGKVNHLIVDEAQDVPWLVWLLLQELLAEDRAISIFGDMNQRRSDWTPMSWFELAKFLGLLDDDGRVPMRELSIGYRSTRRILKFANQLLPADQRVINAIREGTTPSVGRVARERLYVEAVSTATTASDRRGDGLTAIITVQPRLVRDVLSASVGWKRDSAATKVWRKDGVALFVLHPDDARGIEFDAVVVVEPKDFPENFGRDGVLYTSLTRATKDLYVVHSKALPNKLRAPKA